MLRRFSASLDILLKPDRNMSIAHSTSINVTPVATVKQGYASLAVGGRRRKTRSSRFTCLAAVENTFILSRSLAFTDSVLEQSQIYAKQLAEKYENVSFPEIPESSLDVKRLEELSNYLNLAEEKISSNFESISATSLVSKSDLSEKVMRNLELIKASVEQNSSINKLMESSGHLVEVNASSYQIYIFVSNHYLTILLSL